MQDKLKKSISKSENLAELFAERGSCNFSQVGTNAKNNLFFSRGHESQGDGKFFEEFIFC